MNQDRARVLREAKEWLERNVVDPTKTTVGRICNGQSNKLILRAVNLIGQAIQYVDPVSKLIKVLEARLARMA